MADRLGIDAVLWFQDLRLSAPQQVTDFFAAVSSDPFYMYLPVVLIAYLLWFSDKHSGQAGGLSFSLAIAVAYLLKDVLKRPRPWRVDSDVRPYKHAGGYAFPSGHAVTSMSGYGSVAMHFRGIPMLILFAIPVLVMVSRIYLGVHTPIQLIVGAAIALLFIFFNRAFIRWADVSDRRFDLSTMFYLLLLFTLTVCGIRYMNGLGWKFALAVFMGLGMVIGRHADHVYLRYSVPKMAVLKKALLCIFGLLPVAAALLALPEVFGKVAGYSIAGFFTGSWMFFIYPYLIASFVPDGQS